MLGRMGEDVGRALAPTVEYKVDLGACVRRGQSE